MWQRQFNYKQGVITQFIFIVMLFIQLIALSKLQTTLEAWRLCRLGIVHECVIEITEFQVLSHARTNSHASQ